MKIRADFVTNSSSSSYLVIDIHSPLFAKMLSDYGNKLEERGEMPDPDYTKIPYEVRGEHVVSDENGEYALWEEAEPPESLDALLSTFFDALREYFDARGESVDFKSLVCAVRERQDEILDSIESADWTYEERGSGGDSESRINHEYSEDEINKIKDAILEGKRWSAERDGESSEVEGFGREDVTEDELNDYILESTSIETKTFTYRKGEGQGAYAHTFELDY